MRFKESLNIVKFYFNNALSYFTILHKDVSLGALIAEEQPNVEEFFFNSRQEILKFTHTVVKAWRKLVRRFVVVVHL